jgi:hypothetical protein
MQEKAAEELMGGKSDFPLLIPVRVILPTEGHFFAVRQPTSLRRITPD